MEIEKITHKNEEWEKYHLGLLRNKKNEKTLRYYEDKLGNLFGKNKSCQKVIDFLNKSKYKLNLEEREGDYLYFIKLNGKYYDSQRISGTGNKELKKLLDLITYEEVDLDYSKKLAIANLTATVQEDLSLGDKKIIKDIAIENLYSNFEKAINPNYGEIWNWVSCVRLDLHDQPRNQLLQYGFKVKHPWPWIQEINLSPAN